MGDTSGSWEDYNNDVDSFYASFAQPHIFIYCVSGKKLEDICPSTHNMEVPNVKRKDFQLIGMDDDFLSLMDDTGDTRDDLKCPEDTVGEEIRKAIADEVDILVSGPSL